MVCVWHISVYTGHITVISSHMWLVATGFVCVCVCVATVLNSVQFTIKIPEPTWKILILIIWVPQKAVLNKTLSVPFLPNKLSVFGFYLLHSLTVLDRCPKGQTPWGSSSVPFSVDDRVQNEANVSQKSCLYVSLMSQDLESNIKF